MRKGRDGYKLAGECYVHGVMEGEMFDEKRCREIWIV